MTNKKEVSDELTLYKSVIYLDIHSHWERKTFYSGYTMSTCEAQSYLMKHRKIPKKYCCTVLKEMDKMGLISYSKYEIMIIPGQSKILEDVSKINHQLGLF